LAAAFFAETFATTFFAGAAFFVGVGFFAAAFAGAFFTTAFAEAFLATAFAGAFLTAAFVGAFATAFTAFFVGAAFAGAFFAAAFTATLLAATFTGGFATVFPCAAAPFFATAATGFTGTTAFFDGAGAFAEALSRPDSIWRHPWLLFGAVGIFVYVGAEVTIGSLLVNYMGLPQIAGLRESTAAYFLMVYWGGAMTGRFIGSAVLQKIKTGIVLGAAGLCALLLIIISIKTTYTSGLWVQHVDFLQWHRTLYIPKSVPMFSMLAIGFCNSIMFPSIFTLGIQDLGPLTSKGSSLLIAAIVGGALIPKATGILADHSGLHPAFIIPAICYVYIACFGLAAVRRPVASSGLLIDPS